MGTKCDSGATAFVALLSTRSEGADHGDDEEERETAVDFCCKNANALDELQKTS